MLSLEAAKQTKGRMYGNGGAWGEHPNKPQNLHGINYKKLFYLQQIHEMKMETKRYVNRMGNEAIILSKQENKWGCCKKITTYTLKIVKGVNIEEGTEFGIVESYFKKDWRAI
jgi:hypothetical protein